MWYSGVDQTDALPNGSLLRCIGVATSTSPTGPFVSSSNAPAICQTSEYGDIDPRSFMASDGQEWLYWKNDGNAGGLTTHIYARRLALDGQTLIGPTYSLLTNDLPWEGHLIEAPDMIQVGHRYLLFFSGNSSGVEDAGIGLGVVRRTERPVHFAILRTVARIQYARCRPRGRDRLCPERHHVDALHPERGVLPLRLPDARRGADRVHANRPTVRRRPPRNDSWGHCRRGRADRNEQPPLKAASGTPSTLGHVFVPAADEDTSRPRWTSTSALHIRGQWRTVMRIASATIHHGLGGELQGISAIFPTVRRSSRSSSAASHLLEPVLGGTHRVESPIGHHGEQVGQQRALCIGVRHGPDPPVEKGPSLMGEPRLHVPRTNAKCPRTVRVP